MNIAETIYDAHDHVVAVVIHSHKSIYELTNTLDLSHIPDSVVTFDTLFHAGNSADRFLSGAVQNGKLIASSLSVKIVPKSDSLRGVIARALSGNAPLLNASILSSVQQKMLRAGIGI